jgi:hypothetical protein
MSRIFSARSMSVIFDTPFLWDVLSISDRWDIHNKKSLQADAEILKRGEVPVEKTLRQRIMQIKAICEKEALRVPTIADIVSESGEYVSERTIYKLLEDDSENGSFQNHSVIAVYEALISRFGDTDVQDVETLKLLLMERDKQIDRILMQVERREEEMEIREKIYAERKRLLKILFLY